MLFHSKFQVEFGAFPSSYEGAVKDFFRSVDGDQILFTCAGWCGTCGPISGPIRFQLSSEFSKLTTSNKYTNYANIKLGQKLKP